MILPVTDDFLPDIEQYIPKQPEEALREGAFLKIPVLTGITSQEGVVAICKSYILVNSLGFTNQIQ